MIQKVNKVLVAKTAPVATGATIAAMATGEIALFDQNKALITDSTAAAAATSVYFGLKTGKTATYTMPNGTVSSTPEIIFSQEIKKGSVVNYVATSYAAPVEDILTYTLTSATIVAGQRYVIRLAYRDLFEHPGIFCHSYEVFATTTNIDDLGNAFVAKINKHAGRRCSAAYNATTNVLTLTALAKDDNEGIRSINYYTRVNLDGSIYTTVSGTDYVAVAGVTIAKTAGTSGNGYWKVVRDRENAALGYRGITFRTTWPYSQIIPDANTVVGASYDSVIIESNKEYLTPNNSYFEKTQELAELYIPTTEYAASELKTNFEAFLA